MSLVVEAGGDSEGVRDAFIRCDDRSQAFHLLVVSKVSDPVVAARRQCRDVPVHGGVTRLSRTLQPLEPAHTPVRQPVCLQSQDLLTCTNLPGLP